MPGREGFLVVQRMRDPDRGGTNLRYRGVDRLVPWDEDRDDEGFRDPYESPQYASDDGLIFTLELAGAALDILGTVTGPDALEILYIQQASPTGDVDPLEPPGAEFLGYDVAGDRPFYSLVADFPPLTEAGFQPFAVQLNANGLFDAHEVAAAYFHAYLVRYPEELDHGVVIWKVHSVEHDRGS